MSKKGYLMGDYHTAPIETESMCYEIGTNGGTRFVSEETLILASVDCWIKINADKFWQPIYIDDDYFISHRKVTTICFKKKNGDGTIEIWAEGDTKR